MAKKFTPEEIKQGTLLKFEAELSRTNCKFMQELLKSAIKRINAGQDPQKVTDWSYAIEKMFKKLDL